MKNRLLSVLALALAVLFGCLIGGNNFFSRAEAQVAGGQAGGVICVVGEQYQGYLPIVLVDTREQRLLVYEYYYPGNSIELQACRPYMFDRVMPPYHNRGITVNDVKGGIK